MKLYKPYDLIIQKIYIIKSKDCSHMKLSANNNHLKTLICYARKLDSVK